MAQRAKKAATYADIEALPEHVVGQLAYGVLQVNPRPIFEHAEALSELSYDLKGPFDRGDGGPGGWWILQEIELHIAGHVLVPDLAGWRRDRVSHRPRGAYSTIAPDWTCEALSPSTEVFDRGKKMEAYGEIGIGHVWLVDPAARTLEVYTNDDGVMRQIGPTYRENELVRARPFDEIALDLSKWWG